MEPISPFDLLRLFIGDQPPLFLFEIIFRTVVIYVYTLILLRWIGGRSIAQLSVVEFLLVIGLGSAVGDAMFYPEVPLMHAMLAITVIVLLDKAIDMLIRRYRTAKQIIDGGPVEVLRDGRILCDGLATREMGAAELTEILRLQGIRNLGEVGHAYLEASGQLSLFRADPPKAGLAIVPPLEVAPPAAAGAARSALLHLLRQPCGGAR